MDWWVTQAGKKPVGPVSTDLVLRGIAAGSVPDDALICEVGGKKWRPLLEVAQFAAAMEQRQRSRFDMSAETTSFDLEGPPPSDRAPAPSPYGEASEHTVADVDGTRPTDPPQLSRATLDDGGEHTMVDTRGRSDGSPASHVTFDDTEELTIVEQSPLRRSESK